MEQRLRARGFRDALIGASLALILFSMQTAEARVTRIVIDATTTLTNQAIAYQQLRGRAFGELDPNDAHNSTITDLRLGKDPDGKVRYETTLVLTKPVDMTQASGFMWHDVPNRGNAITIVAAERGFGDVGLARGWQADNAGATAVPVNHATGSNHWVSVPYAKNADGPPVTGQILGRLVNRSVVASAPLLVVGNPVPYLPASLDTTQAVLVTHTHETINGIVSTGIVIPAATGRSPAVRQRIPSPARRRTLTRRICRAPCRSRSACATVSIRRCSTSSPIPRRTRTCSVSASLPSAT